MTKLRVHNVAVSLDGFAAGPHQALDQPMGVGGMRLHQWALATPTFLRTHGGDAGGRTRADRTQTRHKVLVSTTR